MTGSQLHALAPIVAQLAQVPASGNRWLPLLLLLLLFPACVGGLVMVANRLFSHRKSHEISKIFFILPLVVVSSLVVLLAVWSAYHRLSLVPSPGRAQAQTDGTKTDLPAGVAPELPSASDLPTTLTKTSSEIAEITSERSQAPLHKPQAASEPSAEEGSSVIGKFFAVLNKAFTQAVRSTFVHEPAQTEAQDDSAVNAALLSASARRPAWVDNPPAPTTEAYEMVVKAGPWRTPDECQQALDEEIAGAVGRYVAWRLSQDAAEQVVLPVQYTRQHLVKDQWLEKINTSLGEMYNLHGLLSFDRQVEGKLRDVWNQIVARARLMLAATLFCGVLLLLCTIYGYLKIDLATGGAYRRRLRLAAAGFLVVVAAGAAYALF